MITALKLIDEGRSVKLVPSLGPDPSQVLIGRTRAEAMTLLPLMFNLCPSAHRLTAASALGLEVDPIWVRALAEETLVEHLMVMARDWPMAFGQAADLTALKGLKPLHHDRLVRLKDEFFNDDIPPIIKEVQAWPAHWGLYETRDKDTAFARQLMTDSHLADEVKVCGPILWLRLWARYREAKRLLTDLLESKVTSAFGRTALGVGWAEAARGRLYHLATLKDDKIATYSIKSPTERLCSDAGQAQAMLNTMADVLPPLRETVAKMILSAVDPCVAVTYVGQSETQDA